MIKIGLKILDEIQGSLSEVKRGERVGAKRKYGTQNKYTGLSKGLEPEEKLRLGRNTWREIRRKRGKREKKKDQLAEVSRRRSLCSEETDWEKKAAHYERKGYQPPSKVLTSHLRKKPKAAGEGQTTPVLVVLGWVRKQAEQAIGSKLVSSTPPWPLY